MTPRSYAILGAGALGSYYGARLAHAGLHVHFLLHSDYDHVRRHGLTVESSEGDFSLPAPHIHRDPADVPPCDVVIVALKTTHNHLLPQLLPPMLGPRTLVLMMQNGMGVEEQAAAVASPDRVLGGLCFVCVNKIGPGHVRHLDYGEVRLGHFQPDRLPGVPGITPTLHAIGDDLRRAGLPVKLTDDLLLARWQKLVWNIPYNGLSVALNATTDQLMADPHSRQLVRQLMDEVVAGARACGRTIDESFVQLMLDHTDHMTPYRTSMKIDFDERRPMEVEAIFGQPLRLAADHGTALPRIEMLCQQLRFIDARNRAPASPRT